MQLKGNDDIRIVYAPGEGWYARHWYGIEGEPQDCDEWAFDCDEDASFREVLEAADVSISFAELVRVYRDEASGVYQFAIVGPTDIREKY